MSLGGNLGGFSVLLFRLCLCVCVCVCVVCFVCFVCVLRFRVCFVFFFVVLCLSLLFAVLSVVSVPRRRDALTSWDGRGGASRFVLPPRPLTHAKQGFSVAWLSDV